MYGCLYNRNSIYWTQPINWNAGLYRLLDLAICLQFSTCISKFGKFLCLLITLLSQSIITLDCACNNNVILLHTCMHACTHAAPRFQYEPQNVTVHPINGTTTAAFSCAVSPALGLIQIQWQFQMMTFSSDSGMKMGMGMGMVPGLTSGVLTNSSVGVIIIEPADSSTSILILDSVSNGHEGLYSCVALLSDGTMLTSVQASLIFDRKY